jgi:hypothetical protein
MNLSLLFTVLVGFRRFRVLLIVRKIAFLLVLGVTRVL